MNHIWYFYLSIYLCNFASVFTKLDVIFHPSKIVSSILILFAKTTQTCLFEKVPIWASLNFVLHHKKLILYLSSQADFHCFPSFLWSSFRDQNTCTSEEFPATHINLFWAKFVYYSLIHLLYDSVSPKIWHWRLKFLSILKHQLLTAI